MIPDTILAAFYAGLHKGSADECWPFEGGSYNRKGWHRQISGTAAGKKRNYGAHRVAYELFTGEIPTGQFVLHKCDNPVCCNPDHLFLGTQSDNAKDMWAKGRGNSGSPKGKVLGPSRFRKFDGDSVLAMYKAGKTQKQIGRHFGCSDVAISLFLRKQQEVAHLVGRGGGAAMERRNRLKRAVIAQRAKGLTQYQVAEHLGISQALVSKMEREDG